MDEQSILALREYDWDMFKADRRYRERETMPGMIELGILSKDIKTIPDMLEGVVIDELISIIKEAKTDGRTLEILALRRDGYTTREIAQKLELTSKAVYRREARLREKIKKIVKFKGKMTDFNG